MACFLGVINPCITFGICCIKWSNSTETWAFMGKSPPQIWLHSCLDRGNESSRRMERHPSIHTAEGLGLASCCGRVRVWALYFASSWMVVVMMGFRRDKECGGDVWHRIYEHEYLHTLCQIHFHSTPAT